MPGNRNKKLLIIIGSIVAVVAIALVAYLLVSKAPVSKEEYSQAARSAQQVSDQYAAFNEAGQEYVNIAGTRGGEAALKVVSDKMQNSLASFKTSNEALKNAAALRDSGVKNAYNAYEAKAQKFSALADQYSVSIPLYASMRDTCSKIGAEIDASNVLQEVMLFAQSLQAQSKADVLALFDKKAGDCMNAASKLKESGSDSFAELGDIFFTTLSGSKKALEARFDESATLGADRADANYLAANRAIEKEAGERIQAVAEKQKKEGEESDYSKEIETLTTLLKSKASE